MRARLLTTASILVVVGGCGTAPGAVKPAGLTPAASPRVSTSVPVSPGVSTGWEITVYYTAVQRFHTGAPTRVTGCDRLDCSNGKDDLGSYPADFVQAVKDEGTGQTADGHYLNWSYDVGYWLDSEPRDTDGDRLRPFVSAAADPNVLPHGTRFTIEDCGSQDDGSAPQEAVCAALRDGAWEVTDEFTPGLGGSKHIDAYIGPETGAGFTGSDWYITLTRARISIG
ncbi:hypothetical protein ACWT_4510 [Actinoplanes sp. SE50]|uniref:hypothetical protein n=1 Tax=unclassified Actinoplanes TaxID=2626549 RepID=UPI00023ED0AF|nr:MULTISPECIES: hypothetical protein [unclassified Actinoplanes]AEV85532.1 hypothetical protein ACPL_4641 [Actinoplanes sp. SE50/110]ATO83925.1 hypothetical protein ACWT_4510 [Actinoplanes sp. SE50]SLM01335.1 hypothetical protein ACSP50_4571 [Actinoplanes sp. SE50/110]